MFKISKKIIIIAVAVFALATVGLTLLRGGEDGGVLDIPIFEQSDTKLSKDMTPIVVDESSPFYEVFQSKDRVNLLLLGVNQGMTDVIMVCSYDMENQYVNLISVPRDTFYYRPGWDANYAGNKINAIYHSEGIAPLAEAVSKILYGMPLHYYAVVEYADIEQGRDHRAGAVLKPAALKRFGKVIGFAAEISVGGRVVAAESQTDGPLRGQEEWWANPKIMEGANVARRDGYLLDRMKTPFQLVDIDTYEVSR